MRVLLRSGTVLFVGGTFRTIGFDAAAGAPLRRTHLAAVSTTDGPGAAVEPRADPA